MPLRSLPRSITVQRPHSQCCNWYAANSSLYMTGLSANPECERKAVAPRIHLEVCLQDLGRWIWSTPQNPKAASNRITPSPRTRQQHLCTKARHSVSSRPLLHPAITLFPKPEKEENRPWIRLSLQFASQR